MVTTACVAFPVRSRANPRLIATVILRNPNQRADSFKAMLIIDPASLSKLHREGVSRVMIPNPALPIHASADERSSLAMSSPGRKRGSIHLPISAGAFVALICVAILVLSGWREWSTREAELKNAEVDVANLSESLTQHADDLSWPTMS